MVRIGEQVDGVGDEADDPDGEHQRDEARGGFGPGQADEPGKAEVEQQVAGEGPGDGVPEGGEHGAPALEEERGEDDAGEELAVGVGVPLADEHDDGQRQRECVDGVEAGEARAPEVTLLEWGGAAGVVVGEDVAGEQEEEADEDVGVIDDGVERPHVRRGEVEEHDVHREQGTHTGERRQRRRFARVRRGAWACGRCFGGGLRDGLEQGVGHCVQFR